MSTLTAMPLFDTLEYADTLKASGVLPQQAEAQARALAKALEVNTKELATKSDVALLKSDLASVKNELKTDMAVLRTELKSDMALLEKRMTIRLGSLMAFGIVAVATLDKII
jgi:uncharacterized protein with gpF-like domain